MNLRKGTVFLFFWCRPLSGLPPLSRQDHFAMERCSRRGSWAAVNRMGAENAVWKHVWILERGKDSRANSNGGWAIPLM